MREHDHDAPLDPESELRIALEALDENDPAHAAHHLAVVLANEPREPGLDDAIERWMTAASDPLALVPIDGESVFRGTVALRAHVFHLLGRDVDAASLLLQVQASAPGVFLWDRAAAWLEAAANHPAAPQRIVSALNSCVNHPHLARAFLRPLQVLLDRWGLHELLVFATVRAARNAHEFDLAQSVADAGFAAHPSWMTANARAMALRARGEVDEAIAAYRTAADLDPTDVTAWLDVGDIALDHDRIRLAVHAYDKVLTTDPAQPWALASRTFVRWWYEGDGKARSRLIELAARESRAASLVRRGHRDDDEHPRSASVNGARPCWRSDPIVRIATSHLEAPSVTLGFRLAAQIRGGAPTVIEAPKPQAPDPRITRKPVDYTLWRYRGTEAHPTYEAPDARTANAIAQLATEADMSERARSLAREFGVGAVPSLLATMVHPPLPLADTDPWSWLFRVQLAASRVIAFTSRKWERSVRKKALDSLLYGPLDWTTTAAMIVLTEIAWSESEHAAAITRSLVAELDHPITPLAWTCLHEPLGALLERLPIDDRVRERLAAIRRLDTT